jgi:plasmid stabilization system protein ParE
MKTPYKLSKQAETDIEEIAKYIWQDSPQSAIGFTEEVEHICQLLINTPEIGRRVEFIHSSEYFYFPLGKFKKFLIFYQTENGILEIIRVLHSHRDIENLFDE